jgi:hypothetical protein
MDLWLNSRSQFSNRPKDGLIEFFHLSPFQTLVENTTYIGAIQPEGNVILFVGHGVLDKRKSEAQCRRMAEAYPNHS